MYPTPDCWNRSYLLYAASLIFFLRGALVKFPQAYRGVHTRTIRSNLAMIDSTPKNHLTYSGRWLIPLPQ